LHCLAPSHYFFGLQVKTTSDLLALTSDAYEKTHDHRVVLRPERQGVPPTVKLDARYKFVDGLTVGAGGKTKRRDNQAESPEPEQNAGPRTKRPATRAPSL
jgi:hypothetical protein